jgi:hypothetical protein
MGALPPEEPLRDCKGTTLFCESTRQQFEQAKVYTPFTDGPKVYKEMEAQLQETEDADA